MPRLRYSNSSLHAWTMLMSSPICCNYNDTAKSCTSRVCLQAPGEITTHAYLGQGTGTKMPHLKPSTRPNFHDGKRSLKDMQDLFADVSPLPLLPVGASEQAIGVIAGRAGAGSAC